MTVDENGHVSFDISGLAEGTYNIEIRYSGYVGDSNLLSATVEIAPVTKYYTLVVKYSNFHELQDVIDTAYQSGSKEVNLEEDYKFEVGDEAVVIHDGMTINGNGHTIFGNNAGTVFNITGDNVVLKNINIVDRE